jgi:adenosylcobyric acid synthase
MRIASLAGAPVLLIADIDRGGVFASIAGTMQLLPWRQRRLIKGFVINKFRGDVSLLKPGLEFLERRYSRPVLGVIPYIRNIRIAQEDSVYLDERVNPEHPTRPDICIIRLPHIACYDDFDPLEYSCSVRYVSSLHELGRPDLIILPGTKATISDMNFLQRSGLAAEIKRRAAEGLPVIGICGGYQMLGLSICDPLHAESMEEEVTALGLLDIETSYELDKVTTQVKADVVSPTGLLADMADTEAGGYEIHMGRTRLRSGQTAFKVIKSIRPEPYSEGAINDAGNVFGTYMHGLFHMDEFTRQLLANLCRLRGIPPVEHLPQPEEQAYDELASHIRQHLDIKKVYELMAGGINGRTGV